MASNKQTLPSPAELDAVDEALETGYNALERLALRLAAAERAEVDPTLAEMGALYVKAKDIETQIGQMGDRLHEIKRSLPAIAGQWPTLSAAEAA